MSKYSRTDLYLLSNNIQYFLFPIILFDWIKYYPITYLDMKFFFCRSSSSNTTYFEFRFSFFFFNKSFYISVIRSFTLNLKVLSMLSYNMLHLFLLFHRFNFVLAFYKYDLFWLRRCHCCCYFLSFSQYFFSIIFLITHILTSCL